MDINKLDYEYDLKIFSSLEVVSQAAAKLFVKKCRQALNVRGKFMAAISGGDTPQRMFKLLSGRYAKQIPNWSHVHIFFCDERNVPPDHSESNFGNAWVDWFSQVELPRQNIHRILGELDPHVAAESYFQNLQKYSTPGLAWPQFDLVFLGMGEDGHTASLFPGPILEEELAKPVMAATTQYKGRPAGRVTLTSLIFNTSRKVVFLVSGESKAGALEAVLHGPFDPERWPAHRIQPVSGIPVWMVDRPAAESLRLAR